MKINYNPNIHKAYQNTVNQPASKGASQKSDDFGKKVGEYFKNVNTDIENSDNTIQELLTGKNKDINSVISEVAKADNSFNLLVGVRNKLIEAYKETMRMQV